MTNKISISINGEELGSATSEKGSHGTEGVYEIGDFDGYTPSKEQQQAMHDLIEYYEAVTYLPLDGTKGHNPVTRYSFSGWTSDGTLLLVMENVVDSLFRVVHKLHRDGLNPGQYNYYYTSSNYCGRGYWGQRETVWAEKKEN